MAMDAGLRRLSLREARIVQLVSQGLSDEQIAELLAISSVDVGAELVKILRKLGLRSRTELALIAADEPTTPVRESGQDRTK
jgi:DNA-binding NarL/FixJ family response regulator